MSVRINPKWQEEVRKRIIETKLRGGVFSERTSVRAIAQWLVAACLDLGLAVKVVSCGVGVTLVTSDTEIYPKCHGTGRC